MHSSVTIFSTGSKFQLVSKFTCSYSSHHSYVLMYVDILWETVIARGTDACFDLSQRLDSETEPLTSSGSSQGYGSISPGSNGSPWCHYDVILAQLSSSSSSTIWTSSDTRQNTMTELTLEPTHYFTLKILAVSIWALFLHILWVSLPLQSQDTWKVDRPYVP